MKGSPETDRNWGIDALRMFSMFLVVVLHTIGQGGILENVEKGSGQYYVAWLLEVSAFCAVDCYALISGFVGVESRFRFSRMILLWFQVVFYTVLITVYYGVTGTAVVNQHTWIRAFFPIMSREYWYMTCYFGMMFLIPVINQAFAGLSRRQMKALVVTAVTMFSVLPCILLGYPFNFSRDVDAFGLGNGYSVLWLIVLYMLGAYLRKYKVGDRIKNRTASALLFFCILLTWGSIFVLEKVTLLRFHEVRYTGNLTGYTSPTILLTAVCFLIIFSKKRQMNKAAVGLIRFAAPASLGVYLIHTHPLIWGNVIRDYAVSFARDNPALMACKIMAAAAAIYLLCSGLDILRRQLFRLARLEKLSEWLGRRTGFFS